MGKTGIKQIGEALGREICQRENVTGLIACAISRIGQQYALSARLINPHTGDIVRSYLQRASGEDQILQALGSMATAIRRDLGESLTSVQRTSRPLPKVTTPSLSALKLYVSGMFLWDEGQFQEAVKQYESALKLDPDFAMAHAKLGSAYCSHIFNAPVKCQEHVEQALRLSDRTTERESLYIRASYAHDTGRHQEAEQLYRLYLQTYPDDYKIRGSLAYLFMRTERQEEAIREYKELLRVSPDTIDSAGAYINVATSYKGLGKYAEALDYYSKGFGLRPEWITSGTLNHEYGFTCLLSGNEAKAREVFAIALAKPDFRARGSRSLALLELYKGRYREARVRLQESILDNEAAKKGLNAEEELSELRKQQ
jgi:tetratricopeptide (TPR) repeat protein